MISPKKFANRIFASLGGKREEPRINVDTSSREIPRSLSASPELLGDGASSNEIVPMTPELNQDYLGKLEKVNTTQLSALLDDFKADFSLTLGDAVSRDQATRLLCPEWISESQFFVLWRSMEDPGDSKYETTMQPLNKLFVFLVSKIIGGIDEKLLFCLQLFDLDMDGSCQQNDVLEMFKVISLLDNSKKRSSLQKNEDHSKSSGNLSSSVKHKSSNKKMPAKSTSKSMYELINSKFKLSTIKPDKEEYVDAKEEVDFEVAATNSFMQDMSFAKEDQFPCSAIQQWIHKFPQRLAFTENLQQNRTNGNYRIVAQEEKRTIKSILDSHVPKINDAYYIISSKWWQVWAEYSAFYQPDSVDPADPENSPPPNSIDNSAIILPDVVHEHLPDYFEIRKDVIEGLDYLVLPKDAWFCLKSWYGGGPTLIREAYALRNLSMQRRNSLVDLANSTRPMEMHHLVGVQVDLFPLIFSVGLYSDKVIRTKCIVGASQKYEQLKNVICEQLGLDLHKNYNLFVAKSDTNISENNSLQEINKDAKAAQNGNGSDGLVVASLTSSLVISENPKDDTVLFPESAEENQGSLQSSLDMQSPSKRAQVAEKAKEEDSKSYEEYSPLVCQTSLPISEYGIPSGSRILIDENTSIQRLKQTLSRPCLMETTKLTEGLVGLENLGNTCYFNSAFQCLSQLQVFSSYFLFDKYTKEITVTTPKASEFIKETTEGSSPRASESKETSTNKEGSIDIIAPPQASRESLKAVFDAPVSLVNEFTAFAKLVWTCEKGAIVAPRLLRAAVSNVSPQFAGFAQHDAQELLSVFLDCIHEELNRVKQKEYIENPEWKGESDAEFSSILWQNHLKRNQSILVPLLHGQMKSVIECINCRHRLINFDPFLFLTLPIPSKTYRYIHVTIVPLHDGPVQACQLRVPPEGTINELVKAWNGIDKGRKSRYRDYVIADIQNHYVFNIIKRNKAISSIRDKDSICLYEFKQMGLARVDSEISIKTSGLKGKQIYGRLTRIHFIHRRTRDDRWRSAGAVKKPLFGIPLINFIDAPPDEKFSVRLLYQLAQERVEKLFAIDFKSLEEANNGEGGSSKLQNQLINESKNSLSNVPINDEAFKYFSIRATNRSGTECRVCDVKGCLGCVIKPEDTIDVGWDDTFCIHWKSSSLKKKTAISISKSTNPTILSPSAVYAASNFIMGILGNNSGVSTPEMVKKVDLFSLLQRTNHLELEYPKQQNESIDIFDCFKKFIMPEILNSDEWFCKSCKSHQSAVKSSTIYKSPLILIIHFNRFSQTMWNYCKNEEFVHFPLDLDINDFIVATPPADSKNNGAKGATSTAPDSTKYKLKSIINHSGDLQQGHYTCFSYNENTESWYLFDDETIIKVENLNDMITEWSYILFYEKADIKSEFPSRCKEFL